MNRDTQQESFDQKDVGKWLTRARKERGWAQQRIAQEARKSPSSVNRLEGGALPHPPVDLLLAIAPYYRVSSEELLRRTGYSYLLKFADVRATLAALSEAEQVARVLETFNPQLLLQAVLQHGPWSTSAGDYVLDFLDRDLAKQERLNRSETGEP